MMTLDDIRNIEFTRGRGYRADEVDDFIDECVAAMEQLIQENTETTQKMKALADKLAEYRNDEDSIRAALLSAQRTGDAVLRDAQAKADELLETAKQEAAAARSALLAEIETEKQELARIQQEVVSFKAKMLDVYKEHLALINLLPEEEPAAEEIPDEPIAEQPITEPQEEHADTVVVAPIAEETVQPNDEEEMKPLSRFADLKFGNDYDIHQDDEDDDEDDKPSRGLFRKKK